jgi:hypothetical protein
VETTHQPSTTATTASSEEPANDFESNKLASEDVDDNCFICGEAGEVLLCDYPMCRKVYHQVTNSSRGHSVTRIILFLSIVSCWVGLRIESVPDTKHIRPFSSASCIQQRVVVSAAFLS